VYINNLREITIEEVFLHPYDRVGAVEQKECGLILFLSRAKVFS